MNEKLKNEIRKNNKTSDYKIKYRKRKSDYALYLDLQRKNNRQTINLNLFVAGQISNLIDDKSILNLAIRQQRISDEQIRLNSNFNLATKQKLQEIDIIKFIHAIADSKEVKSTKLNWRSIIKQLIAFSGEDVISFKRIDKRFCEDFADFLRSRVSPNTGNVYFAKFKQVLYKAIDEKIIDTNPAARITIRKAPTYREFLVLLEIKQIYHTDFYKPVLKNAFVFSCFTGLRFVDIKDICFEQIQDSYLIITQSKTKEILRIKLHPIALEIIETQKTMNGRNEGIIFNLPKYENCRYNMHKLTKEAGIKKRITFHSGRHTFATLCLTYDIDIYTVSKLLGHKDIKHTQIYAKIIDKKRDQAIDKLPTF